MTGYSTHWTATICAAIILNFAAIFGLTYALPKLAPQPPIADVAEIEWVDVDLADDVTVIAEEAIPQDEPQESLPTFNAQDLVVPELSTPELIIEPATIPPPEVKPIEPLTPTPKPKPPINDAQETKPPPAQAPAKEVAPSDGKQVVTRPPITVNAVYPESGSGLGYKGYVSFAVHIDKNGKITSTEILQSSGRYFVDEIARKAAEQWTFKPALDQIGRPMECDKIITFDFKKFS